MTHSWITSPDLLRPLFKGKKRKKRIKDTNNISAATQVIFFFLWGGSKKIEMQIILGTTG